jgi:hypothetical protein
MMTLKACNYIKYALIACCLVSQSESLSLQARKSSNAPKSASWDPKSSASFAFCSSLLLSMVLLAGPAALAFDAKTFTNDYIDPFHPQCRRHIEVAKDGKTFRYSGSAVGPKSESDVKRGCTPKEIKQFGLRAGSFEGVISGDKISAGDGIHEGVWEPTDYATLSATTKLGNEEMDGIRWNDGNKWTVKTKTVGVRIMEVVFWAYLGFSTLAGVKGLFDAIERRKITEK